MFEKGGEIRSELISHFINEMRNWRVAELGGSKLSMRFLRVNFCSDGVSEGTCKNSEPYERCGGKAINLQRIQRYTKALLNPEGIVL